jgi:GTPase
VLLSDTVGFIRNLPHTLVTSFRATLEEVQRAELVLHVVDASAPEFIAEEQKAQVEKVLEELEAQGKKRLLVRNKIDLLPEREGTAMEVSADEVNVSALRGEGLGRLLAKVDAILTGDPVVTVKLKVPQSEGKVLAQIEAKAKILSRSFRGGHVYMKVQAAESALRGMQKFLVE